MSLLPLPVTTRRRGDHGMATAELAVVTPVLVALGVLLLWTASLGYTQVRLTDAARETARMIARGDPTEVAEQLALDQSPAGSVVEIDQDDGVVVVTVSVRSSLPGGWFDDVVGRDLDASAVAAVEVP
ncbi:TadE family type IV pilus minor pilin [Aeromicrobium sp. Leaf350]|uniref:TadE family type IV pilus minor pilin n=1 Tax=Aeromicrobium sp. Leaf350 TaxID=2876565 RepID=UPI001E39C901|nr:TadE family type IV pilus minor pilin [Aeromicrobium sp. Leaf350]